MGKLVVARKNYARQRSCDGKNKSGRQQPVYRQRRGYG